jgi:hypothetical protein
MTYSECKDTAETKVHLYSLSYAERTRPAVCIHFEYPVQLIHLLRELSNRLELLPGASFARTSSHTYDLISLLARKSNIPQIRWLLQYILYVYAQVRLRQRNSKIYNGIPYRRALISQISNASMNRNQLFTLSSPPSLLMLDMYLIVFYPIIHLTRLAIKHVFFLAYYVSYYRRYQQQIQRTRRREGRTKTRIQQSNS